MNTFSRVSLKTLIAVVGVSTLATGCYVVPVQPDGRPYPTPAPGPVVVVPAAPTSLTLSVRLYPNNDAARAIGVVTGQVTNFLDGRGQFSSVIAGETFTGEATRSGHSRSGLANGVGNRGSYLSCSYSMNNASQGTGHCTHSNGATFSMHIGG